MVQLRALDRKLLRVCECRCVLEEEENADELDSETDDTPTEEDQEESAEEDEGRDQLALAHEKCQCALQSDEKVQSDKECYLPIPRSSTLHFPSAAVPGRRTG